jgi:hypothetical protein
MARRGQDAELLEMLRELATIQRANAARLERLEEWFGAVRTALPALMVEPVEQRKAAETRRFVLDEIANDPIIDGGAPRRPRRLNS